MTEPAPRTYDSPLRAQQARETRRRIRAAALPLFQAEGYTRVSMDRIAKAAGVSRQTVFDAFGSKSGLLKEIVDVHLVGDDEPVPLVERETSVQMMATDDPADLLRQFAHLNRQIAEGLVEVWPVFAQAAATEPVLAELQKGQDEARMQAMRGIAARLAELGGLREDWGTEQAAELMWVIAGPAAGLPFIADLGWSADAYEQVVAETLMALLLRPDLRPELQPEQRR